MASGNRGQQGKLWALTIALGLHAAVLAYFAFTPLPMPTDNSEYVEVAWLEEPLPVPETQASLEETLAERIDERVANLRADARAERSAEARSSGDAAADAAAERAMADAVEAELRAFEAAEAARLAAEAKEFGIDEVPDIDNSEVETLAGWDRRFDGQVTVTYDCPDRTPFRLDVPGYRCKGGGTIEVQVAIGRQGEVLEANAPMPSNPAQQCLWEEALKSARRSQFEIDPTAPKSTACTIRYVFVPQQQ